MPLACRVREVRSMERHSDERGFLMTVAEALGSGAGSIAALGRKKEGHAAAPAIQHEEGKRLPRKTKKARKKAAGSGA